MKNLVVLLTISMICVASASAWTSVYSDNFDDGVLTWTGLVQSAYGSPVGPPVSESGGVLNVSSGNWGLAPYDTSVHPVYKMSVEVDFQGFTWLELFVRSSGTQDPTHYDEPDGLRFDFWNGGISPTDWQGGGNIASYVKSYYLSMTYFTGGKYIYEVEDYGATMIARIIDPCNPANFGQTTLSVTGGYGGLVALGVDPGGPGWPGLKSISYDNFDISIPEPITICLLGFGALSLIRRKRA